MKELKEYLALNPHVDKVYFDKFGNWFLHRGRTCVSELTRKQIEQSKDEDLLPGQVAPDVVEEGGDDKKGKKK